MPAVRVKYDAPATVSAFLQSSAFVRCIVGPVGSGKSSGCVLEILRRAREQQPGPDGIRRTRFAVIRNTYGQLRDTTRKTFEQWVPHPLGEWNEQQLVFKMRFGDVECEVLFRALDKPGDVNKLLSLELTGAYINELRELPKDVLDALQARVGRFPSRSQGGPSWFGIWADTNPWFAGHWLQELHEAPPKGFEFFWQPDGLGPDAENLENLPPDYYPRLMEGKDTEWIDVYLRARVAKADRGSYYGALLEAAKQAGCLAEFTHATDEVFTSWDLGHGDSTAIWMWLARPDGGIDFIDHYECNGEPLSHYFRVLAERADERGYVYARHFLPHDARAKTLQTGRSIAEMCLEEWGAAKVEIVPMLSLDDGIQAGRWLLEHGARFHPRCSQLADNGGRDTDGVKLLRAYRRRWDENRKCYSDTPLHDFSSHTADAYRYAAVVARNAELLTRKPPPVKVDAGPQRWSLDELWDTAPSRSDGGRI
jgi:hypothetical protein